MGWSGDLRDMVFCGLSMGINIVEESNPSKKQNDDAEIYDLVVIGGGINGAGIARDAAGRGLKVLLCEKQDFGQHTSSASTKLIHGGLRYLEHYDFALVRHSLIERENLMHIAPHIIWPLRFVLPHHKGLRPKWLIRMGLFLYDHLTWKRSLPSSRGIRLKEHKVGEGIQNKYSFAFEYSDCWVQDARLVVLNVMDAESNGARVCHRTHCTGLQRKDDHWRVELTHANSASANTETIVTKAVVNASGPWADATNALAKKQNAQASTRLVRGSHIIVPRLFSHEQPYLFQNADERIVFAIPFERDYTLIGTTDVEIEEQQLAEGISAEEIDYLCDSINQYLKNPIAKKDIVWSYSGVRPLYDDSSENASKVTRDYKLVTDDQGPLMVSVYGGKITTYRRLAEDVLEIFEQSGLFNGLESRKGWTASHPLPGGDIQNRDLDLLEARLRAMFPRLQPSMLDRFARHYGSISEQILRDCTTMEDLGQQFGGDLYQLEVDYLCNHEYAVTSDDILWRRTKLGLKLGEDEVSALQKYLESKS